VQYAGDTGDDHRTDGSLLSALLSRSCRATNAAANWGLDGGEIVILVILRRIWTVSYPTDGGRAAFIARYQYGNGSNVPIIVSYHNLYPTGVV